jgi:hypothetical protein
MGFKDELRDRAQEYARQNGLALSDELGAGVHGIVFLTESQPEKGQPAARSAIKAHQREADYRRERDIYLRLRERRVSNIRGCHVPQLLEFHDALLILEMTVVTRPFVLDFAGAYLDQAPDFPEEALADWRADKQEQFGKRWPEVQAILRELEARGIYMEDVSPANISFVD